MSFPTTEYLTPSETSKPDLDLEEDLEDDEPDQADGPDAGDKESGPSRAATRTRTGTNRALVRRVANKAAELAGAPKARKETLASMLGCSTDLAELTFAVMTADRSALAPAADLNAIASEDRDSAAILALSQGRARIRGVWSLLVTLNAGVPAAVPASDAKAAIAIAKAIAKLPDGARDELSKVVSLGRKS